MQKFALMSALLGMLVLAAARSAQAIVFFENVGTKNLGDTSLWPEGLALSARSHPRVAGQVMDAPTFGNGSRTTNLYFEGDFDAFNKFLRHFAKVKHESLKLVLHTGKGMLGKNPRSMLKIKEPVPFDWSISVSTNGFLQNGPVGAKVFIHLNYYLSNRGHVMGLDVPGNIHVVSSEVQKNQDDVKDPTARAIDTFVRLRQERTNPERPASRSKD